MNIASSEFNTLKKDSDKTFNLSLVFVALILFVFCYFGSSTFFEKNFDMPNIDYWKIIYHNLMAFVLFFGIGLLYTKFVIKSSPFGLKIGNFRLGGKVLLIATIVVPIVAITTIFDNDMVLTYPLIDFASVDGWQIALYFVSYIAYYIGWEYLFRGILLFGTRRQTGIVGAILISTLVSALIHTSIADFGKPMLETLSALPAGLIFGYIAIKTDSIYYSLYIHALIGILTDIFIFLIV